MEAPLLKGRDAVEPPLLGDQVVRIATPIELRVEALVETPLLKELMHLGAEDNTTAAGLNVHNPGKGDLNSGRASGQRSKGQRRRSGRTMRRWKPSC